MIRLIAAAGFAVTLITSAQAITPAPLTQPDGMFTQVRFGCGPGRTRVAGVCVAKPPSAIPAVLTAGPTAGAIEFPRVRKSRHPNPPGVDKGGVREPSSRITEIEGSDGKNLS